MIMLKRFQFATNIGSHMFDIISQGINDVLNSSSELLASQGFQFEKAICKTKQNCTAFQTIERK